MAVKKTKYWCILQVLTVVSVVFMLVFDGHHCGHSFCLICVGMSLASVVLQVEALFVLGMVLIGCPLFAAFWDVVQRVVNRFEVKDTMEFDVLCVKEILYEICFCDLFVVMLN